MLWKALERWNLSGYGPESGDMALVFHTSCVNYDVDELEELAAFSGLWLLPDNVYWELRLLEYSPQYRRQASYLLSRARRERWDLEDLYEDCAQGVGESHSPLLLFLFGDLAKQDEFLRKAAPHDGFYILQCREWAYPKDGKFVLPGISTLRAAKNCRARRPIPLNGGLKSDGFQHFPSFRVEPPPAGAPIVSPMEFRAVPKKSGANADIYECYRFPEKLIKGYRDRVQVGSQLEKLELLQFIASKPLTGKLPLALPIELLYCDCGCVGFSMKNCPGNSVQQIKSEHLKVNLSQAFRSLFLLLLELHTRHILVNDLSFNNVLITRPGEVYLVDCDSFQVMDYPGGGITGYYRHPEVSKQGFYDTLRDPLHEYFALAVLMYQIIFKIDNPLYRCHDKEELVFDWDKEPFPLEADDPALKDGVPLRVNDIVYKNWMKYPRHIRAAFADEFHFRKALSIGAWTRILEILP